jgi:hypothetical protein
MGVAMRLSAIVGVLALGSLTAGSAMANTPFWATLIGLPAPGGGGAVSTDLYYTGPLLFSSPMGDFTVYCTDLNHNVEPGGSYEFIFGPLTENGAGQPISEVTSNEIGQIAAIGKNGTGDLSIAAQAAIWELAYPGLVQSFSGPDAATIGADYNNLLSATYNNNGNWATALIPYGYNPVWPGGGPQEMVVGVPEPSTWAMMLAGFAGLGFFGYRSRRAPSLPAERSLALPSQA